MSFSVLRVLALISGAATVASIGYCGLAISAAIRFLHRPSGDPLVNFPGISLLKPLKGADPELYEALRSHCLQDYPAYEILFGITEPSDPGAAVVEKLMQELPQCRIRLVRCEKRLGANGKVSTLAQLAPLATHGILLVNDSDIRVPPDYLRTIAAELQGLRTGMVTCLYRGVAAGTLPSRLESLGISTDFVPGVLAAWQLEGGLHFGLGSTLAFRRDDLQKLGGFEAILDYLADDYELGRRISETGLRVELSKSTVTTHLPAYNFAGFFAHQLRWARTIRTSRPGGYAGLLLTFTFPWSLATLILARGAVWAWAVFGATLLMRVSMAIVTSRSVLQDRNASSFWLLPLRDLIAVFVWLCGLVGNKISWRGERFLLAKGKLRRV